MQCNEIETLHAYYEKSVVKRANQYLKSRIEGFNDYYHFIERQNCDLYHIYNWILFFVSMYNDIKNNKFKIELRGKLP